MSGGDIQGRLGAVAVPIDAVFDGTSNRLAVDAKFTAGFIAEVQTEKKDDSMLVYGSSVSDNTDVGPANNNRWAIRTDTNGRLTIITEDGNNAALGNTGDASTLNTVIGRFKNLLSRFPAALGQTTSANSLPVVLASDQSNISIVGNVANGAADSGNPLKMGFKANTRGAPPASVAAGQRVDGYADLEGRQLVAERWPGVIPNGTRVALTTVQTSLIAANTARVGLIVTHVSGTQDAFVGLTGLSGALGAETFLWRIQPGETLEVPPWAVPTGQLFGITGSGTAVVNVSEKT